jgi:serine/threonine protein kinase
MVNATQEAGDDPLRTLGAGVVIDGKYRVDQIIGRGGMGVVVAATHLELGERVALKFLQIKESGGAAPDEFRARFALEARVCAKLQNEHIARVRDVGVWQGTVPFMVMEYLVGTDLRRLLRREKKLPTERAVSFVVQICEALAEAHAHGIVHRDLKPANVFITSRHDGAELLKVLDFGISKWRSGESSDELTRAGTMLGSPKYMSPEQLRGAGVDGRADVWSIGAMFYEMLTGRPPFDFPNVMQTFVAVACGTPPSAPSTFEPSIPPEIDAVILRALTHDLDQRVQNVAELAGAALAAIGSPFAGETRTRLSAILDPAFAALVRVSSIPLGITTGSYAAYSVGRGRSVPIEEITPVPVVAAPDRTSAHRGTGGRARFVASGAALLALTVAVIAAGRGVGASLAERAAGAESAASARAKTVAHKELGREMPTTLVEDDAEATAKPAPPPAGPRPVTPPAPIAATVNPLSGRP